MLCRNLEVLSGRGGLIKGEKFLEVVSQRVDLNVRTNQRLSVRLITELNMNRETIEQILREDL